MPAASRFRIALLWVLAIASIVIICSLIAYILAAPHDGISMGAFSFEEEGLKVNHVLAGGTSLVHDGDIITHMNGVPVDRLLRVNNREGLAGSFSDPVDYTLLRYADPDNPGDSPAEELTVSVTPQRLRALPIIFRTPVIIYSLTFLAVGLFVFSQRQTDASAQIFWLNALYGFALINDLVDYQIIGLTRPFFFWAHYFSREFVFGLFGMVAIVALPLIFPRRLNFVERHKHWVYPLMVALVVVPSLLVFVSTPAGVGRHIAFGQIFGNTLTIVLIATLVLWGLQFLTTKDPVARAQLRWIGWGVTVGLLPIILLFMIPMALGLNVLVPFDLLTIPLLVIPAAFGISVARYRLWDIDVLINRSIVYGTVVAVLGVIYLVMVTLSQQFLLKTTGAESDLAIIGTTILMAAVFQPARNSVQRIVNNTLFARQFTARQRIRQFGRQIGDIQDMSTVLEQILTHACEPLGVRYGFMLTRNPDNGDFETVATYGNPAWTVAIRGGDPLQDNLRRGRPVIHPTAGALADIALAVPLVAFGKMEAVLALGRREIERDYNADDREALRDMADQAALVLYSANLQEELLSAERFSAVGAAASAIVHDIRNQMGAAAGYAELLAMPEVTFDDRKRFAASLIRAIQGFSLMATEVLDMARGESNVTPQMVSVPGFFDDVHPLVDRLCEASNIRLTFDAQYQGEAYIDAPRMQRALFNLCQNAHDALLGIRPSEGRQIAVSATLDDHDRVVFRVSDNGPGVPDHLRSKLFDPFVTEGKSSGTGLGLAIVKKVVEAHKGEVSLEPDIGRGATFEIRLPRKPQTNGNPPA